MRPAGQSSQDMLFKPTPNTCNARWDAWPKTMAPGQTMEMVTAAFFGANPDCRPTINADFVPTSNQMAPPRPQPGDLMPPTPQQPAQMTPQQSATSPDYSFFWGVAAGVIGGFILGKMMSGAGESPDHE